MVNSLVSFSGASLTAMPPVACTLRGPEFDVSSRRLRRLTLSQASCRSCAVGLGVVRDSEHEVVGVVEGLIINPRQRVIDAMVVRPILPAETGCYLLPLTSVCARFDKRTRCLEVEIGSADLRSCGLEPIDPDDFSEFSDDDWLDCVFGRVQ
jgi:hypothetical protein